MAADPRVIRRPGNDVTQPTQDLELTDLLLPEGPTAAEIERRCRSLLRRKFGGNPMARDQMEDLVQEVLMAAFKQAQKIDAGSPPVRNVDAWLCRVTMNAVWRTWHREGEGRISSLDQPSAPADLPAPATLPLDDRLAVRQALGRLDAECQRLLWRREVLGEARKTLAAQIGVTSNTLGVRLHRCRKRLLELFERQLAAAAE